MEHGSMLDDEGIQLFLETGTYLVPTLFAMEVLLDLGEEMGFAAAFLDKAEMVQRTHSASFQRAAKAGVKIAVGTDAISTHMHGKNARELEYMVHYGFTPMQAIVAATKTSAEACRVDARVGTLEPGKSADLLIIDGDPLDDIAILQDQSRLKVVMKEGKTYVDRL